MGYDLHITRRKNWTEHDSGPAITRDEFARLMNGDARFRHEPSQSPGFYVPKGPRPEDAPWLDWSDGEVCSKNPPQEFVVIMVALADRLNARVVRDDGEQYGRDGSAPQPERVVPPDQAPRRASAHLVFGAAMIVASIIACTLVLLRFLGVI